MKTDKQIKQEFKKEASKDPDKYFATKILKQQGFVRKRCKCGTYFWTTNHNQELCGDPACSGGFHFIGNSPAKHKLDYIETWQKFASLFKKWGYTPIKRYPVVARWRDDADFVQASIYDFQPYVVNGIVEPPANPLVVPQFCLRFNDIDNVGITGAHFTGFVMIGQHAFVPKEKWDQDRFFLDIHNWLKQGLGLPNEEITYHEDAWAGGGNFGPCMEYFSRGLELGNQVYMLYEQTQSGSKELNLKVLDMGMGHERNTWFCLANTTSYESVFPTVCKNLYKTTGVKPDTELIKKFLPYASYLNVDEVENIERVWTDIAKKLRTDATTLKQNIHQLAALYSIGEHSRALLVAISDGALPSNVGGGYNLRVILRRALSFIEKYKWNIDLPDICKWHASYLKPLFPELSQNLDNVTTILEVEKKKYEATKQKSRILIQKIIKKSITPDVLVQLYDSQGIAPEIIKAEAKTLGKDVPIPENFYAKIAELHEIKQGKKIEEKKLNLEGLPETKALYYDDYTKQEFKAKVIKIIEKNVILDQTLFYPTAGGQDTDKGTINNCNVIEVLQQNSIIVHVLDKINFKEGDTVQEQIDFKRRKQLTQHHTSTHIINAAARQVLGNHINQAGAKKTIQKAHLDVTHYQNISDEELNKIENLANKIIKRKIPVYSKFMLRNEAEKEYSTRIYQGGAVPGKRIRIIDIKGIDVEACGGTHLKNTSEAELIKIIKTSKIQDGIVRIEFVAGDAAKQFEDKTQLILKEISSLLKVPEDQIPARAEELFQKWKLARKAVKKKRKIDLKELELKSKQSYKGDVLEKTAQVLSTQPEHVSKTIKRFLNELEEFKKRLGK